MPAPEHIDESAPAWLRQGGVSPVWEQLCASGHWLAHFCSALFSAHRLTGNLDFESAGLLLQAVRLETDLSAARRMISLFPHLLGRPPAAAGREASAAGCLSFDELERHCLGDGEPARRRQWRVHLHGCAVCRDRQAATEEFLRVVRLAVLRDELRNSGVLPPGRSLLWSAPAPGAFPLGRLLLLCWTDGQDRPRRDVGFPEEASPWGVVLLTNNPVPEDTVVRLTGSGTERTGVVRYTELLSARWRIALRLDTPPAGARPKNPDLFQRGNHTRISPGPRLDHA